MTIYFTASITGKKDYLSQYEKIISVLKLKHHSVISDHILVTSETQIRLESREERITFHKRLEKWISSADCLIVETTFPSISVGYEVSLGLRLGKPVLLLYCEGDPPSLLSHITHDKIVCEKYTPQTLKPIIEDFLNFVQGTADQRFTFFITPEITSYLDKVARLNKMPKSVFLRNLIEREMKK